MHDIPLPLEGDSAYARGRLNYWLNLIKTVPDSPATSSSAFPLFYSLINPDSFFPIPCRV
ncbi:hypothetical protein D0T87_06840 [Bacteroides sp. 51]|nr:hypothetical protein [Bacteroides sp. 51]